MVDPDIIIEWITKADEDFEFDRINFEEEKPFFSQICFHFNQSAEKYLKAYIIANKLGFRKIHNLPLLLKQCSSIDLSLDSYCLQPPTAAGLPLSPSHLLTFPPSNLPTFPASQPPRFLAFSINLFSALSAFSAVNYVL